MSIIQASFRTADRWFFWNMCCEAEVKPPVEASAQEDPSDVKVAIRSVWILFCLSAGGSGCKCPRTSCVAS